MKYCIGTMEIEVKPSRGKTMRLKIDGKTAEVFLYLPRGVSDAQARAFVLSKREWIEENRRKIAENLEKITLPKGKAMLFGLVYDIAYSDSDIASEIKLAVRSDAHPDVRAKALDSFYKKRLAEYISQSLPLIERATGLKASDLAIRKMTSRWGSCNVSTGKITFSLGLAKKSKECIDYVILHELAHLLYANHGAQFKAFLSSYMPDWKKRKKVLNGVQ
ncbi:MAG: M48 family metallopeptidase [Clostridia bacterium]|nr:M48 family metallopeptidase [Clostridia bacterium]